MVDISFCLTRASPGAVHHPVAFPVHTGKCLYVQVCWAFLSPLATKVQQLHLLHFRRCSIAQADISKKLSPKGLGQLGKSLPLHQVGTDHCLLTFTQTPLIQTLHISLPFTLSVLKVLKWYTVAVHLSHISIKVQLPLVLWSHLNGHPREWTIITTTFWKNLKHCLKLLSKAECGLCGPPRGLPEAMAKSFGCSAAVCHATKAHCPHLAR